MGHLVGGKARRSQAQCGQSPITFWSTHMLIGSHKIRRFVQFGSSTAGPSGSMPIQSPSGSKAQPDPVRFLKHWFYGSLKNCCPCMGIDTRDGDQ